MASVFAGFVVGYAMSIIVAPVLALALLRNNRPGTLAHAAAPPGTNVVALSVLMQFGAMLVLTAIGIILGLALSGLEDRRPASGLGSPNVAYTALVLILTVVLTLPALAVPSARRYAAAGALVFVAGFGWVTPWVATLA